MTDPIFLGPTLYDISQKSLCGLKYDSVDKKYYWGGLCDGTIGNSAVDFDVAIHSYIMGFQYEPSTKGANFLAA